MRQRLFAALSATAVLAVVGCEQDQTAPAAGAKPSNEIENVIAPLGPRTLSGVVSIAMSRLTSNGSGPTQNLGNPPGRAANVGPNVVANRDGTGFPQNEMTIALDPNNPARLLAGANDYRNDLAACGVYGSTAAGASWTDIGATGTTVPPGFVAGGDPAAAFGPDGTGYFVCLGFTPATNATSTTGLFVVKTTDLRSLAPAQPVIVTAAGGTDPARGIFNDKEYITVDTRPASPYRGRIYVTWTRFAFDRLLDAQGAESYLESPIVLRYSSDGAAGWSATVSVTDAAHNFNQGSVPAIGPNGEVYVVYENGNTPTEVGQVMVSKSVNGGVTFQPPVKVGDLYEICDHLNVDGRCALKNSEWRVNSFPSTAVDANDGTVYVVWGDYRTGNADVLLSRSRDGGKTWSAPVRVSTDVTTSDQVYPWVAVPEDGAVHVMYQQRDDTIPQNRLLTSYLSTSRNHGSSFAKALLVSSGPSDPNTDFDGTFIGDYNGLAASSKAVHPIWTDMRGLEQPNSPNQDAVTTTVTFK